MFATDENKNSDESQPVVSTETAAGDPVDGSSDAPAGAFSGLADPLARLLRVMESTAQVSFKSFDEQALRDTILTLAEIRRLLDAAECHAIAEMEAQSVGTLLPEC